MRLSQDPVLGETMMQLVPAFSPVNSHTVNHIDFDLDLLDCQVPSPCPPSPDYLLSPTMFSPDSSDHWAFSPRSKDPAPSPTKECAPSPCPSSSSSTPYSPAARHRRSSSTYMEQRSVQDSWQEFQQLQDRIKQEQELLLDTMVNPTALVNIPTVKREPFDMLLKTEPGGQELMMTSQLQELSGQPDHPVLKQFLQDTSFQTKYNLKPFTFGGVAEGFVIDSGGDGGGGGGKHGKSGNIEAVGGGLEAELEDVKPVLDLAVQQVRKDIETTCEILSIPRDPRTWSSASVKSWVLWTLQQFSIPLSSVDMSAWNLSGDQMFNLTEIQFVNKIPQGGETLFAQYDLWKSNWEALDTLRDPSYPPPPYPEYTMQYTETAFIMQDFKGELEPTSPYSCTLPVSPPYSAVPASPAYSVMYTSPPTSSFSSPPTSSYTSPPTSSYTSPPTPSFTSPANSFSSALPPAASFTSTFASPPPYPTAAPTEMCVDEEEDTDEDVIEKGSHSPTGRTSSNIHLWQFVKELLLQPSLYGNYINWVDRSSGIFKIVDSVKVATLWGKRKNRPAMNYDKLSRSLRQYYKKGIMKKTERSQRLVYQFCHPYHI